MYIGYAYYILFLVILWVVSLFLKKVSMESSYQRRAAIKKLFYCRLYKKWKFLNLLTGSYCTAVCCSAYNVELNQLPLKYNYALSMKRPMPAKPSRHVLIWRYNSKLPALKWAVVHVSRWVLRAYCYLLFLFQNQGHFPYPFGLQ